MNITEALQEARSRFQAADVPGSGRDASVLLTHIFEGDREIQFRAPETELTDQQVSQFESFVDRRCHREPVSHIVGNREFWSRSFYVNQHVLDPRPDSETLIEAVLGYVGRDSSPKKILDLGTGSGCLLLTLLAELEAATGTGVDISPEALKVAKKNADFLEVTDRVQFYESSWFGKVSGQYDIIVSNPPYIESDEIRTLQPEVTLYEPLGALDGGADGLDCYRLIISNIIPYLSSDGFAIFEVGQGQADDVAGLMKQEGFVSVEVHNDLASIGRCVSGRVEK